MERERKKGKQSDSTSIPFPYSGLGGRVGFAKAKVEILLPACTISVPSVLLPGVSELPQLPIYSS